MAVATYTKAGTKSTTPAKLDKSIFGLDTKNHQLIKEAYLAYQSNGRDNLAQTKTRGLVSGGGKKPWKQKGTGRARVGSSRTPVWRGGGVVFGPTGEENFRHKIHKSAKRLAVKQALSLAANSGKIIIIENLLIKDNKTSEAVKLLNKIGANRSVLLIVAEKNDELNMATRNIKDSKLVQAIYLNVFDIINSDNLVITNDALSVISDWLGGEK